MWEGKVLPSDVHSPERKKPWNFQSFKFLPPGQKVVFCCWRQITYASKGGDREGKHHIVAFSSFKGLEGHWSFCYSHHSNCKTSIMDEILVIHIRACVCVHIRACVCMLLSQHSQIEDGYFSQDCIVIIHLLDRQVYSLTSYKPLKDLREKVQNKRKFKWNKPIGLALFSSAQDWWENHLLIDSLTDLNLPNNISSSILSRCVVVIIVVELEHGGFNITCKCKKLCLYMVKS